MKAQRNPHVSAEAHDPRVRVTAVTPTDETGNQAAALSSEERVIETFDLMLNELVKRSEAKTIVMEEALERCEWSQRRFWGINE